MRTTYVVLLLTILSAASSYGFDLGISAGVRDWDRANRADERETPMVMLTVGNTITPNSPIRLDAVAGAWTHEVLEREYSFWGDVVSSRAVERPGYAFGLRAQLDNRPVGPSGHRLVRPVIGAGAMWTTQKDVFVNWFNENHTEYWNDQWLAEALVGIAIPMARSADLLLMYTPSGDLRLNSNGFDGQGWIHSFLLGYRFSVLE